jgi:hypothetical protein
VVASSPQHGASMANSPQSTSAPEPEVQRTGATDMGESRMQDEGKCGSPSERNHIDGELEVLGKATCPGEVSVCPETEPALISWALRPADLARLLNSTPLGEVIGERMVYRHRTRAGSRITEGRRINVVRYVAWLHELRDARRRRGKPKNGNFSVQNILELLSDQGYRCALAASSRIGARGLCSIAASLLRSRK